MTYVVESLNGIMVCHSSLMISGLAGPCDHLSCPAALTTIALSAYVSPGWEMAYLCLPNIAQPQVTR